MRLLSIILISSALILTGCVQKHDDKPVDESTDQTDEKKEKTGFKALDNFVDNMEEIQKNMEEGQKYEVVDFRELKALLPESIGDLKRQNAQGEKNSAMGFTISRAEADYTSEDGSQHIDIELTDMTGASGLAGLAAWGWTMTEIDKETETGYEKTTKYQGHKAFEKYDNEYQSGSIEALVSGRFLVSVNGNNVSMEVIKNAFNEIDIGKLESMKDAGLISE